jgi:hypothetical protein
MTKNYIKVADVELTADQIAHSGIEYPTLEIEVRYTLGGYGGFDWTHRPRGYQVAVTPCRIKVSENGFTSRESTMMGENSGGFVTVEEAKRKSQKRMQQIADAIDPQRLADLFVHRKDSEEANRAFFDYLKEQVTKK